MSTLSTAPTISMEGAHSVSLEHAVTKRKLASLDAIRCLSAINVVIFHAAGFSLGGAFLLTALSITLTARTYDRRGLLAERAKRLLLPWLFWSFVYVVPDMIHVLRGRPLAPGAYTIDMILTGTAVHLWYLPFAFCAITCVSLVLPTARIGFMWILLAAIATVAAEYLLATPMAYPLPQWTLGVPAVCLGIGLNRIRNSERREQGVFLAMIIMWLGCGYSLLVGDRVAIPVFVGSTLLCFAWMFPWQAPQWLSYCANLGYGVYLMHPMALWFIDRHRFGFVGAILLTVCLTGAITAMMRQTRLRIFV